jgi:phosphoadenosine phosphosulfate reductase
MATGFGPEGIVLLHILHEVAPQTTVFYLDTELFFPETYQLKDNLETLFGMEFERVASTLSVAEQAGRFGPDLWERDPDHCCRLRKVLPLREYLRDKKAWVTGIRREQTAQRAIEWDAANGLVKINPLHHKGYPSIGCAPCTRPVTEGADPRSGRWVGRQKVECGIHMPEVSD